jgi:hypothetical protein
MNDANGQHNQPDSSVTHRSAGTAARVFFISGILYCLWMVLDIVMVVLALGPVGLVFGLTALPNRGILIIMCFAAARTAANGRYLSAAIALSGYALLTNVVLLIITLTTVSETPHPAVFATSVALSAALCVLSLIAMRSSISAYRNLRAEQSTTESDSRPEEPV